MAGTVAAALLFSAAAIFWTWPVAANLTTRVAHDAGDPILNLWILWWNAQAVPFSAPWWNPPMMWPMPGAMALSEHLAGLSIVATPLQLAGMGPIGAYNVCLILTYALSGFFAYLLVLHLTGSRLAAVCGGLAFGFAPYRASQLPHIQVLSSQWMPLALLGMHAYMATKRRRCLAVFALSWLLLALSNGYYLLFFPVLMALWLLWFVNWRREPRPGFVLTGTWLLACLPLIPVLLHYRAVHVALDLKRTVPEIREFSAVPQSFLHAAPLLRLWPEGPAANYELYLFPGATVLVLAALGVVLGIIQQSPGRSQTGTQGRTTALFYALAAIAMAAFALGPGGSGDEPASMSHPFSWLLFFPGYNGIRVSSRFAMLMTLCLSTAAGLGAARLASIAGKWGPIVGAVAMAGLAADGLTEPVPILSPPGKALLPPMGPAAVIELPIDNSYVSVAAMYRSIFHGQPLANGYSGHFPPHYNILTFSLARGDTSALSYLARRRLLVIIMNDVQDPGHGYRKMIEAVPGIRFQGVTAGGATFVLPAQPEPRRPVPGTPLEARARIAGKYLLEFDLGGVQQLSALEIPLRKRYPDFAARLRIETSDDAQSWREVFADWTGGLAVEAALNDPLLVPVRIYVPGASGRYVRVYPASDWMKDETKILGDHR